MAEMAMAGLHGMKMGDRALTVKPANDNSRNNDGGGGAVTMVAPPPASSACWRLVRSLLAMGEVWPTGGCVLSVRHGDGTLCQSMCHPTAGRLPLQ